MTDSTHDSIDCACVIHGDAYDWSYVDKLHSMLIKNFSVPVRLHVLTERERVVPDHVIKHDLMDWPAANGRRRGWWYKMQLFQPGLFSGRVLYMDLDLVITGRLDWMLQLSHRYFWTVRDFKHLWRPSWQGMNSSVMLWDTTRFAHVWQDFCKHDLGMIVRRFAGDQDYLNSVIDKTDLRFFDDGIAQSWRWQVLDGGMDMRSKSYRRPSAGGILSPSTQMIIFHGRPKPHEVQDPILAKYWC